MSKKPAQTEQEPGLTVYPGDATPGGVPAKRRAPQLRTLYDVATFQAALIRQTYRGELDADLGGKLCFMLNSLRASIELAEYEDAVWLLNERVLDAIEKGTVKDADRCYLNERVKVYLENVRKQASRRGMKR